jgi:protein disulfide-isomerase-like protein
MRAFFVVLAILSVLYSSVVLVLGDEPSDVTILTPDNFYDVVGKDKHVFVAFTAPWCGHCKALKPEFGVFATAFKKFDNIVVANVDADVHKSLGSAFGVTGFPSLKYFAPDSVEPDAYSGGRTADDLTKFMNGKAGTKARVPKIPTNVVALDESKFDAEVLGEKGALVEFFAPWCGHCKKLAPEYEKVASSFVGEDSVVIASVDATEFGPLASKYDVTGYPTIKWFPPGSSEPEDYSGGRSAENFIDFINEKMGTERVIGGGYFPNAGRIDEMDALLEEFLVAGAARQATILEQAQSIADTIEHKYKGMTKFYILGMKKYIKVGSDYATNEIARLERMLKSDLTPAKQAEFNLRINVANAFASGFDDKDL